MDQIMRPHTAGAGADVHVIVSNVSQNESDPRSSSLCLTAPPATTTQQQVRKRLFLHPICDAETRTFVKAGSGHTCWESSKREVFSQPRDSQHVVEAGVAEADDVVKLEPCADVADGQTWKWKIDPLTGGDAAMLY
eukprot:COSAG06_NODE_187_length_20790_cov_46.433232_16_plen_136_part_00